MSEERCDVAVIGAGLVGVSLAYELACLGTSVTVIDAGHPGRATDAGAGILSPVTSMETDKALWLFSRQAGAHYPDLLQRMASDGVDVSISAMVSFSRSIRLGGFRSRCSTPVACTAASPSAIACAVCA